MPNKLESLNDLFVDELRDLYNAENQLVKALPKMAQAADSPDLRSALEEHLNQTKTQIQRLDKVFQALDVPERGKECVGMKGIIQEGQELLKENASPAVKDAGIITAAQKTEHYEIAGYGSVCTFAEQLGYREQAQLLKQNLNEEKKADELLTKIAERHINKEAKRGE
jgi:ferritin-like metal-binding protein YciE